LRFARVVAQCATLAVTLVRVASGLSGMMPGDGAGAPRQTATCWDRQRLEIDAFGMTLKEQAAFAKET